MKFEIHEPKLSVGVFDYMHRDTPTFSELYGQHLDMVRFADEAGINFYFVAEHHMDGQFAQCPSPGVFLGAAARATRRIRLGPLGYVVPLWNPVRLAEEISMLDQISDGRLELGLVSGINENAFEAYRADYAHKDSSFWIGVHELLDYLPGHDLPLVQPRLSIWHPSRDRDSLRAAAQLGWSTAQWVQPRVELVRQLFDDYCKVFGDQPFGQLECGRSLYLGLLREIYVGETNHQAYREAAPCWVEFWERFNRHPLPENIGAVSRKDRRKELLDVDHSIADNSFICGNPDNVAKQINQLIEATGANCFLGDFAFGCNSHWVMKSMDLFSREVRPQLKL